MKEKISFPKGFLLGTATASYQIEGAYNEDGKSENIWDRYTHEQNGRVFENQNGDVAIDTYHRLEEDLDHLKELGCKVYRFSLSWSRIMPNGTGEVNPLGVAFYNRVIDGLIVRGIVPAATIYHWDLPVVLQDKGGWANSEIIKWYSDYAKVCFDNFGDRVHLWFTLNEPFSFLMQGYGYGAVPPCITDWKICLQAIHNALRAHGTVVKYFKENGYNGKIGLALDLIKKYPKTDSVEDINAAELANQTTQFWFYDAIYKGKYPEKAVEFFTKKGFMPEVTDEDMELISQKLDFVGINYYLTMYASHKVGENIFDYEMVEGPSYEAYAEGFYEMLMKVKNETNLPIFISENGIVSITEEEKLDELNDDFRIDYLGKHFNACIRAINDGVDVFGYTIWTAMDNFEWNKGNSFKMGLIYVDYENNLQRVMKKSGKWFKQIAESIEN